MRKEAISLRAQYYPDHLDYSPMQLEYAPFIMFMQEANYRSKAVNTDKYGLRFQYFQGDQLIDLCRLKDSFECVDVLVGNSTAFGVDCSSDKSTITHHLNDQLLGSERVPVINLGIRGATSRQELMAFLSLRDFMPRVRNIVILSGICNATAIGFPNAFIRSDYGVIFSEAYNFELFCKQYDKRYFSDKQIAIHRFHEWADIRLQQNPRLENYVVRRFSGPVNIDAGAAGMTTEQRFLKIMDLFRCDMENWAMISRGIGAKISFVMQPAINWTGKKLSEIESRLFENDYAKENYYMKEYATRPFFEKYGRDVQAICEGVGVPYFDANNWLNADSLHGRDIFVDVCHLTDEGNRVLANELRLHGLFDAVRPALTFAERVTLGWRAIRQSVGKK